MVLHIFSPSKKERTLLLQRYLQTNGETDNMAHREWGTERLTVDGVKHIKMQTQYLGNPGFWIKVAFKANQQGKQLYHRLLNQLPPHCLNDNVFYPKEEVAGGVLETKWMEKYAFSEDNMEEASRLFLEEMRSHLKAGRANVAYHGVLLLLRLNPFFLKKYRRYYILEDLAFHYEGIGNIHKALKCFQLQIRIRPDSPEPYLNISSFYIVNEMEEKALPLLKRGLQKHGSNPYLMSNMVIVLCNLGDFDGAIAKLRKALEKDLHNGVYWKMLGDVYYEIEDNDAAMRCFKKGIRFIDEVEFKELASDLHSGIAACYYEGGHYNKALKHYLKLIELQPDDSYTLIALAQLYFYKLHQSKEALKYTKRIIEVMPENGYAHYHIGLIYMDLQLVDKARWHLYKARRLMPYYNPVHEAIQMLRKEEKHQKGQRKNLRNRRDQS